MIVGVSNDNVLVASTPRQKPVNGHPGWDPEGQRAGGGGVRKVARNRSSRPAANFNKNSFCILRFFQ